MHLFEDFAADPGAVLASIFAFLGVDPGLGTVPERAVNVSGVPRNALVGAAAGAASASPRFCRRPCAGARRRRSPAGARPAVPLAGVRGRLDDVYREDVAELERLLERPLDRWRPAAADPASS